MELSIDTATRYAGAALSRDGAVIAERAWHSANNHTAELAPAVEGLLHEADSTTRDIGSINIIIGPGGFSALRVGLGFAKGLAESLDIAIAPVSALEVEAARHFDGADGLLCPVIEVGRDRVAWCVFERDGAGAWGRTADEAVTSVAEMVDAVPADAVFCGEGAWHTADRLRELGVADARVIALQPPTRSLALLAALGKAAMASGAAPDRQALEPNYLRPPSITMPGSRAR